MYKFQFLTKSCKYHICTLLSIYKIQQESKILEFMQTLQRVRSDCQQQSVSFSHNKNLYDTPVKNSSQVTAQKTLKKSILQKLQASKNLSINRPISKKLSMKQSKQQESAQKQLMKANNEQMTEEKQIILNNQSPSNPGFYQYAQWLKINELFFKFVNKKFVEEFWKILRLINYGQVFIPTGLIFQIFVDIKRNSNSSNFQNIINKFLKQNQTVDRMQNFKDLKSYTHISIIEKSYKCMDQNDEIQNTVEHNQNDRKLRTRSQSAKNVFQRNYAQAKFRTDKKISKICQNLIKQVQQIQEKPKISVYKSESYRSLVKPERICKHADQHKSKSQQEKYMQENNGVLQNLFKAKQLDRSIFESNVDSIPGVLSHLSRNKFCQAEKLKAKRESEKPQYSKKKKF